MIRRYQNETVGVREKTSLWRKVLQKIAGAGNELS